MTLISVFADRFSTYDNRTERMGAVWIPLARGEKPTSSDRLCRHLSDGDPNTFHDKIGDAWVARFNSIHPPVPTRTMYVGGLDVDLEKERCFFTDRWFTKIELDQIDKEWDELVLEYRKAFSITGQFAARRKDESMLEWQTRFREEFRFAPKLSTEYTEFMPWDSVRAVKPLLGAQHVS